METAPSLTGVQINYYFICKRKLWLFSHGIQMEQESDRVFLGKLMHEESYDRESKEIFLGDQIRLDRISPDGVIHETKMTNKMEKADIWQLKYYLYYLKKNNIWPVTGEIDYPKLRKTEKIQLTQSDCEQLDKIVREIGEVLKKERPPEIQKMSICKKCAYFEYCWG